MYEYLDIKQTFNNSTIDFTIIYFMHYKKIKNVLFSSLKSLTLIK